MQKKKNNINDTLAVNYGLDVSNSNWKLACVTAMWPYLLFFDVSLVLYVSAAKIR